MTHDPVPGHGMSRSRVTSFTAYNVQQYNYYNDGMRDWVLLTVELMKSYRLPLILYATEAVSLSATNIRVLDNCINRALYKIFGIGDNSCLSQLRTCLGLPSVADLIERRRSNFMDQLIVNGNHAVGLLLRISCKNLFY